MTDSWQHATADDPHASSSECLGSIRRFDIRFNDVIGKDAYCHQIFQNVNSPHSPLFPAPANLWVCNVSRGIEITPQMNRGGRRQQCNTRARAMGQRNAVRNTRRACIPVCFTTCDTWEIPVSVELVGADVRFQRRFERMPGNVYRGVVTEIFE